MATTKKKTASKTAPRKPAAKGTKAKASSRAVGTEQKAKKKVTAPKKPSAAAKKVTTTKKPVKKKAAPRRVEEAKAKKPAAAAGVSKKKVLPKTASAAKKRPAQAKASASAKKVVREPKKAATKLLPKKSPARKTPSIETTVVLPAKKPLKQEPAAGRPKAGAPAGVAGMKKIAPAAKKPGAGAATATKPEFAKKPAKAIKAPVPRSKAIPAKKQPTTAAAKPEMPPQEAQAPRRKTPRKAEGVVTPVAHPVQEKGAVPAAGRPARTKARPKPLAPESGRPEPPEPAPSRTPVQPARVVRKRTGPKSTVAAPVQPPIRKAAAAAETGRPTPLKIFLPTEEAIEAEPPAYELLEEYGENTLLPMTVDPSTLFVSWEIVPQEIAGAPGDILLRVYDVTGIEFDGLNAHRFIEFGLKDRIGNDFFHTDLPGREAVVEIGILPFGGSYRPIMRSGTILFPLPLAPDELGIAEKLSESGVPFGY